MGEETVVEIRKPGYFAVIPASVRYDPELRPNAKLLYGEITALASSAGYCFAGNKYFSELYGLGAKTISELISSLAARNHIRVEIVKTENGAIDCRRIWIAESNETALEGIPKNRDTPKNRERYPEKSGEGIPKNREDNNTRVNKTVNNTPIAPKLVVDRFAEFATDNPALFSALLGFAEMRSKKKNPINTERSANILLNKLTKLSSGDDAVMVDMLDEATLKGWSSVYPPKDGPTQTAKPPGREVVPEW